MPRCLRCHVTTLASTWTLRSPAPSKELDALLSTGTRDKWGQRTKTVEKRKSNVKFWVWQRYEGLYVCGKNFDGYCRLVLHAGLIQEEPALIEADGKS